MNIRLATIYGVAVLASSTGTAIGSVQSFDSAWRFIREDAAGAEAPEFNDSTWRVVDVPHDWSIEDLPLDEKPVPVTSIVQGKWRFHKGDDIAWKDPYLNDHDWQEVTLPDTWEHHSDYTEDNVYGWYRRHVQLPSSYAGKEVELFLGMIDDVDETYLNGVRIGGTGSFPPTFKTAWNVPRRYRVPAGLVHGDGTDVVAVRVFDGTGSGGIYAGGAALVRVGPFDPASSPGGASTGHVLGGTGWYRKRFILDSAEVGKVVSIVFDGVYMDSDVWINGHHQGNHPYGYTPFAYDLTPHLKAPGQENVLAVRVRNEGKNSRWYSGSGIFRHVRLSVTDSVHVSMWGLRVSTIEVGNGKATVEVQTELENARSQGAEVTLRTRLISPRGKSLKPSEVSVRVAGNGNAVAEQTFEVTSPDLWSPDTPGLYRAEVELLADRKPIDSAATTFGIRVLQVDAEHGFRLNGKVLKLRGGCVHHDNGPLGAAAIDRAEERRVELLKANGFNAIRTSHNPPSSAFLDACDRLGMLVIDEAFDQWEKPKNPQDYHLFFKEWANRDIAAIVRRDRNHPSVVMWSIGNEIQERFDRPDLAHQLREAIQAQDQTRPITAAICGLWDNPSRQWEDVSDGAFQYLDIGGYNYLPDKYEPDHARNPQRVMVCTESYPKQCFDYWAMVEKHPYVIGDFVWTAMDYLGESGIGHTGLDNEPDDFLKPWPWFNAYCGDLDLCGFKKPQSYYRDVVWGRSQLEVGVHRPIPPDRKEKISGWGWPDERRSWTWPGHDEDRMQVNVYSRYEYVRVELNRKLIGEKPVSEATQFTARFNVPYAKGELRVSGLTQGKVARTVVLKTAGVPKKLRLTPDRATIRADRNDLAFVTAEVLDDKGERVPYAQIPIKFSLEGPGELAAVGSGNPSDAASFRAPVRTTFEGRCLAIVRPLGEGTIMLHAEVKELEKADVKIQVQRP